MSESGPIRKTYRGHTLDPNGFLDIEPCGKNVFKAIRDGKRVLLKTSRDDSTESILLLHREYEISCNLHHPFISSALEYRRDSPVGPAIVLEYVEGRTLGEFLKEGPAGQLRRKILAEILDAVKYLHRSGLLHNDIKPDNIIITAIGDDVKLIDFGMAENDSDYLAKRLGGTPGSSAPEVLSGENLLSPSDARSDIYALGGIIRLLFPHRYARVAKRCLREDISRRYKDIDSLTRAISAKDRSRWTFPFVALIILFVGILLAINTKRNIPEVKDAVSRTTDTVILIERVDSSRIAPASPGSNRAEKEQPAPEIEMIREFYLEKSRVEERLAKYRQIVIGFYDKAEKRLESEKKRVPFKEFLLPIYRDFFLECVGYKEKYIHENEFHFAYDTLSDPYIRKILNEVNSTISISEAYDQGMISREELEWYRNLCHNKQPYKPFEEKEQ